MQIDPESRAGALKVVLVGLAMIALNFVLWRVAGYVAPSLLLLGALAIWAGLVRLLVGTGLKSMPLTQRVPAALIALMVMLGLALLGARAMGWPA